MERDFGFQLTDELRELYKWHDGMSRDGPGDFIPGHRFLPLDEAVRQSIALRSQIKGASFVQRTLYNLVASHKNSWLTILDDGAGDGYFFDSTRVAAGCEVFYAFTETGDFQFFPSLKNLFDGIRQCYEGGVYKSVDNSDHLQEDYEASVRIWSRLATWAQ